MKKIGILFILLALLAPAAQAASPWTEIEGYKGKVVGKLEFGVRNFLGGWTEFFTEPYHYYKEDKNVLTGVGKGIWDTVACTIGGVLHIATFPVTNLDVPLPENGVEL